MASIETQIGAFASDRTGADSSRMTHSQAYIDARDAVEREAPPHSVSRRSAQREKAEQELSALGAEQAAFPGAIALALRNKDSITVKALRARDDELRIEIRAARIRAIEAIIAELRARANAMKVRGTIASRTEERTRFDLVRAWSVYATAAAVRSSYVREDYAIRLELIERGNELQRLRAEV